MNSCLDVSGLNPKNTCVSDMECFESGLFSVCINNTCQCKEGYTDEQSGICKHIGKCAESID